MSSMCLMTTRPELVYLLFVLLGLEEEGFEMLEQLEYLYLANNKVSHTQTHTARYTPAAAAAASRWPSLCL